MLEFPRGWSMYFFSIYIQSLGELTTHIGPNTDDLQLLPPAPDTPVNSRLMNTTAYSAELLL